MGVTWLELQNHAEFLFGSGYVAAIDREDTGGVVTLHCAFRIHRLALLAHERGSAQQQDTGEDGFHGDWVHDFFVCTIHCQIVEK